jgi:Protein of unknown function (DUF2794)
MIMVRPNDPVTAADGLDRAAIFALRRFRGWRLRALQPQGANYRKLAGGGAVLALVKLRVSGLEFVANVAGTLNRRHEALAAAHAQRNLLSSSRRRRRMSLTIGDGEPGESRGAERGITASAPGRVTFNRLELNRILNLYGRMVADGEWRDYAIDFLKDRAVFSIFRRSSEMPLYRIEKDPRLARKQGAYSVVSASGHILRRGHELDRVLLAIDRKPALV